MMYLRALFKQEARRALSGQYPEAMAVAFFASLMPLILLFAPLNPAMMILSLLVMGPLLLAICRYFLAASSPKRPTVSNFFSAFNDCLNACWAYLWQCLWTILWLALFIVPGIIKWLSYSMQFFLLAEYPALGARRSLELSKRLTAGYKWELFVTVLSFSGWAVLSIMTFGIALLYVVPYYYTTMAQVYRYLKEQALIDGRLTAADLPKKRSAKTSAAKRPASSQSEASTSQPAPSQSHEANAAPAAVLSQPVEAAGISFSPAAPEGQQPANASDQMEGKPIALASEVAHSQSTSEEDTTYEQQ